MHIRMPLCATLCALVSVTLLPHAHGGALDNSLFRAAIGAFVGLVIGAAVELFLSHAGRRASEAGRKVDRRP